VKTERLGPQVSLSTDYGFWSRDGLGFVNVISVAPGGRLEDVYLYEMSSIGELQQISHARSASYRNREWVLEDVQQSQLSENHVITRTLDEVRRENLVDPAVLEIAVREPEMLPVWGLRHYIVYLRDSGLSTVAYEVAFWSKVFTPLSILAMLFLAVPVVLGSLRTVGIGQRIFVGALVGAGFHLLTRGFSYAALVYEVNPALATGVPLFLFAGVGLLLLSRLR
jgi:lipopolysaccharide export system permease protein